MAQAPELFLNTEFRRKDVELRSPMKRQRYPPLSVAPLKQHVGSTNFSFITRLQHPLGGVRRGAGGMNPRLSLANVKVCTKKIPWPRTCHKGALKLTSLRAARRQAGCAGVPTGILLTWGAPAGIQRGIRRTLGPCPQGSPRAPAGDQAAVPLTSARSRQGYRALLRPAPTTP